MQTKNELFYLQMLSVAHFVVGGIAAIWAAFSAFTLAHGVSILSAIPDRHSSAQLIALLSLLWIGGWTMLLAALAPGLIFAGFKLRHQTNYQLCFVIACAACLFVPLGTALGVFTLIVLSRPSVKSLFNASLNEREARRIAYSPVHGRSLLVSTVVWFYDSICGIGHDIAPFRIFGENPDLGKLVFQCPKNSPDEIRDRRIGGAGNYIVMLILMMLGTFVLGSMLALPIIRVLKLPNGAPATIGILLSAWLAVIAVGGAVIFYFIRKFRTNRTWELNVHELGLDLKTPKIELRTRFDQISDIHFGTKIAALENKMYLLLYMNPLYTGIMSNLMKNILTIRLCDRTVFRIPNAKAVFNEESVNRIIQHFWLTRPAPSRANPPN